MKRRSFLITTACEMKRFERFSFRYPDLFSANSSDDRGGKRADYTLDDAFRFRLMLDMVGGEGAEGLQHAGLSPSHAGRILDNMLCRFERGPLETMEPGLWGAVAVMEEITAAGSDEPALRYTEWFSGKIEDLPEWLAARSAETNAVPVRIFTVNISRAAQFVRTRADELGLPEALEGARTNDV